jgi:hypothetical protein
MEHAAHGASEEPVRHPAGTPVRRRKIGQARRKGAVTPISFLVTVILISVLSVVFAKDDYRLLAAPVAAIFVLGATYLAVLWRRDGDLPIFDIGTLFVVTTLIYSVFPFIGFMLSGLSWGNGADSRLQAYTFDVHEVALFGWRYALYLGSFVPVYLWIRQRKTPRQTPLAPVPPQLTAALVVILAAQYAFKFMMAYVYGLNLDVSYDDLMSIVIAIRSVPYVLLQISFVVFSSIALVKWALFVVMIQRWSSLRWRMASLAWVIIEVAIVGVRGGARSPAVLLLLVLGILFHRFVRPLKFKWVAICGTVLLAAFLVAGAVRGTHVDAPQVSASSLVVRANEFQALFATAFDIHKRKESGTLGSVPWQLYVSDLYLEIPSQILPFEKIDPSVWYLELLGIAGTGVGFMFGVMAQAMVGLDWIELALRGAALGLLFGLFHRYYVRHASRFWLTVLYLFISIWSFYSLRATTFWFMHFVIYQFIPVCLIGKLLQTIFSQRYRLPFGSGLRRGGPAVALVPAARPATK